MTTEQSLKSASFQNKDARTVERKHLNEILDDDNPAENMNII